MKALKINTSKPYDVLIGAGLLRDAGKLIGRIHQMCTAVVITDNIVDSLYAGELCKSLADAGFFVRKFIFKNGEHSKNIETYTEILRFLADNHITRTDMLIALGGGVVGDITGFVAATYLRGISFIQIPTTFLSAIDSSVGGNTGLDLAEGKNLVGVFCQPDLVLCDTSIISQLPSNIFAEGAAEAIKYGVISDSTLFSFIENGNLKTNLEEAVYRCVKIKSSIVEQDEFELGCRQILNFGHTIGHALEAVEDFDISHGYAVGIGMCMISHAAYKNGYCSDDVERRINNALKLFGLPTKCGQSASQLLKYIKNDKKRDGNNITLILPEEIGSCFLKTFSIEELYTFIENGDI